MANPYITLERVSYTLPNGKVLFSDLSNSFDLRPTALVGQNGVGKSILAKILAAELSPTQGHCLRAGRVHYLPQQVADTAQATVAQLTGVAPILNALARISAGRCLPDDVDTVGQHWDMPQRLQQALQEHGLSYLDANSQGHPFSGGEAMRLALIRAKLSDAEFLILDEPSNHLDRGARLALLEYISQWPLGLLLISHDRELLAVMQRIVELSPQGLRSYGGNYHCYMQQKTLEQNAAQQQWAHHKTKQRRQEQALQQQVERQARRQSRANKQGKTANQAKILLDRQKDRSQLTSAKLHQRQRQTQLELAQNLRQAADKVQEQTPIYLHLGAHPTHSQAPVAQLNDVRLPWGSATSSPINLLLQSGQRIGVQGPNGCGKSTLLNIIAGHLTPLSGKMQVTPHCRYLDQRLTMLQPELSVLAQLSAANRLLPEHELRMRLAQLGLDAQKIQIPSGQLSGGERLKAALACLLYAQTETELLLLDEPDNHLDLTAIQALEHMLLAYQGCLLVVSHDEYFLQQLALTARLVWHQDGWQLNHC